MRARVLVLGAALLVGGCLYSEYGVVADGGGGVGGRGGGAGSVAGAGRGGATTGAAGTGAAGTTGVAGTSGVAGSTGASGGSGGTVITIAGTGGTTGVAGAAGGTAGTGRGGTTGVAGTGGAVAGRGGTTGVAGTGGTVAGRGGTTGAAGTGGAIVGVAGTGGGTAGRGGTTGVAGTGGGAAGRGGTTGSGGSTGTGGSTAAPNWVPSFSVVYQLDGAIGQLAVEAHGILQLNEIGTFFPIPDPMGIAIEGSSAQFRLMAQDPGRLVQPAGTALPSQLQTPDGTSFTMGGWFRINSTQSGNIQYLISNDGPGDYMGGFVFYLDQTNGSFGNNAAKTYCRIGTSGSTTDFNYNEAESPSEIGTDANAGNRWAHLVCRYDANQHTLSLFVGGSLEVQEAATKPIRSGPGPFMLGCDQAYCGFAGNMDEVFFTRTALDEQHINRIYACGIDGSRCRCSGMGYVTCGFAGPSGCTNIPYCDTPQ